MSRFSNRSILDITVNPGNSNDSMAFGELYDRRILKFPEIAYLVMDCGFKTAWICKRILDDKRIRILLYKKPMGKAGFFRPCEYVYDEFFDCVLCPENRVLNYAATDRDGYRQFKSKPYQCETCPSRAKCTEKKISEDSHKVYLVRFP